MRRNKVPQTVFFITATILLFLGFYRNQWNAALPGKFRNFQKDSESLVIGRMVESRQSGLFSHGGLMGRGNISISDIGDNIDDIQYESYLTGNTFSSYDPYSSQNGAQGLLFGLLDRLSPFPPTENLRLFRVSASMALAVMLGGFLLWILNEFGLVTGILSLITTVASPWLTLFGRNLFYVTVFFYLPMITLLWFMAMNGNDASKHRPKLGWLVFATVLLKCLFNGFDFILPSIGMLVVPLFYFGLRDGWRLGQSLHAGMLIAISAGLAITVSLTILSLQITVVRGNIAESITYLSDTLSRRTLGSPEKFPEYAASLQVSALEVLKIYFSGKQALGQTGLRFLDLTAIFLLFTIVYLIGNRVLKMDDIHTGKGRALIITTWVSFLIPIAWYTIFKGQAFMHPHTNFLAWYMPFTLLGFALCGFVIQRLVIDRIVKPKPG